MDTNQTRQLVANFIELIWNQQQFDQLDTYLHVDYIDYSLPKNLSPDCSGLMQWIQITGRSFLHRTIIDDQVTEPNKTILKVTMEMTHIGEWRGIQATGLQVQTSGYRFYKLSDGKIIEHWAGIDGTILENALRQQPSASCKVHVGH